MARQQQDVDELFDVKNAYYIGNYQQCINEAQKLKLTDPELIIERDAFMYRAYIAQNKFRVIFDEIKNNSPKKLQYLRMLAEYFAYPSKRESIVNILNGKYGVTIPPEDDNDLYRIVCATIFYQEGNTDSALEYCFYTDCLECKALSIQMYFEINRSDLARNEFKKMVEKDEDATLTQLAQAWVYVNTNGEKLQDAYYIYQELIDKYNATPMLLNGQAVAFLGQEKWEEAEGALQEALDKDNSNPDTLINLIILSHHLDKQEVANRYLSQLRDSHPDHRYIKKYDEKKSEFDKLCTVYAPSNPIAVEPVS